MGRSLLGHAEGFLASKLLSLWHDIGSAGRSAAILIGGLVMEQVETPFHELVKDLLLLKRQIVVCARLPWASAFPSGRLWSTIGWVDLLV